MSILTGLIFLIDLQSIIISILKKESRHISTDNKSPKQNTNAVANKKGPIDNKQYGITAQKSVIKFFIVPPEC